MLLKFARVTSSKGRKQQILKESLSYVIFETIHYLKVNMPDDKHQMLQQVFKKVGKQTAM